MWEYFNSAIKLYKKNKWLSICILFLITIIFLFLKIPIVYEGFKKWKNIKSDIFKIDTVENSISFNNLNESDTSKTSEYIVENITCNENEEIIDVEILQLERNKEVKDNTKITDTVYTFSLIVFPPLSKVFIDSVYQGNSDLDLKLKKGKYFVFAKKKGFIEHCEIIHIPTQRLLTIELKKDE